MIEKFTFIKRAGLPDKIFFRIAKELGIPSYLAKQGNNYWRVMDEATRRSVLARAFRKAKQLKQQKNIASEPYTPPPAKPKKPEGPEQLEFDF